MRLRPVAHIETGFAEKFGVPRQSGLADSACGQIVFTKDMRDPNFTRGLEQFSYIWILWGFSGSASVSPTVRPPRLGGSRRIGVFATRSPFRPNPIALSSVRVLRIEQDARIGPVIVFAGADMMNGSPVYDIKPYIPGDMHQQACTGFAASAGELLAVCDPDGFLQTLPDGIRQAVCEVLALDPRPAYHEDPGRTYGMTYSGFNIRFRVDGAELNIIDVRKAQA